MIDNCDILVGNPGKHVELNRPNLKAILLNSAGSDYYIQEGVLHAATRLANASGSYGKAIAEHTIGMMLALNKILKTILIICMNIRGKATVAEKKFIIVP